MKQVLFGDLEDGKVFRHGGVWYMKCLESRDYNALIINRWDNSMKFPSNLKVEVEK